MFIEENKNLYKILNQIDCINTIGNKIDFNQKHSLYKSLC